MEPATSRLPNLRHPLLPDAPRRDGEGVSGEPVSGGQTAADHLRLAQVRVSIIGALAVVMPPALVLMGYASLVVPVFVGAVTLLAATAIGYYRGRQTHDLRGAWLFYAGADTLVILLLSLLLGNFMDVFLIAVVVELARIYRHGRLVIAGGLAAAALILGKYLLVRGAGLASPGLRTADQTLLLVLTVSIVLGIVAVSLSTFIQHYAREIFSYERIQAVNAAELHVAHEIQTGLMAPRELESGQWAIAAISVPAKEVGGDFYEYIPALGNSIGGIAIGDVSGKGIPAALQMAVVRTIFRIEARRRIFPAETLTRVNQSMQTDLQTQGMVTLLYAFVDPIEGVMHYANAGHNYPILINQGVHELKLAGLPLGVDGDTEYDEKSVPIEAGASVVFYTDGVVEAVNSQGELFGFERLFDLLADYGTLSPRDLVHQVVETVQIYAGDVPQNDDITIVVLHHGAPVARPGGSAGGGSTRAEDSSPGSEDRAAPAMLAMAEATRPVQVSSALSAGAPSPPLLNGKEGGKH